LHTIRYVTIEQFNVDSKGEFNIYISQDSVATQLGVMV